MFQSIGDFWIALVRCFYYGELALSHQRLTSEDMRGRHMAIIGFSWLIPIAIGPFLAGMVMDYWDPDWIWYLGYSSNWGHFSTRLRKITHI